MPPKYKNPKDSFVTMTEMVLPNDTNPLNNLMGGRLMHLMDVAGAIAAQKHCNRVVVTASVDSVSFKSSVPLGGVVTLEAHVSRAFNSSMEVYVEAYGENILEGKGRQLAYKAFLTFVAVDQMGNPIPVPELIPESEKEKMLYEGALRRRQLRLVLAGRMKPNEAQELKSLFFQIADQNED